MSFFLIFLINEIVIDDNNQPWLRTFYVSELNSRPCILGFYRSSGISFISTLIKKKLSDEAVAKVISEKKREMFRDFHIICKVTLLAWVYKIYKQPMYDMFHFDKRRWNNPKLFYEILLKVWSIIVL